VATGDRERWQALVEADMHRIGAGADPASLVRELRRTRSQRPIITARLCQAYPVPDGPAGRALHLLFRRAHRWAVDRAGMDLPWEAEIGPGFAVVHGWGLVVSPDARIGANVTVFHGVTIGRKDDIASDGTRTLGGAPTIEDGVWIGPHAVVVGAITVGAGSRIGGGTVVTKDVPPRSLVVGNPGKVIESDVAPDTPNPAPLP
jgi:serine O-acetyltransferase